MPESSPSFWSWLRTRLFPRGTHLIQWASYVILLAMLITHVLRPVAGSLQFNATLLALVILLALNIVWEDLKARFSSEITGYWVLLLTSTALAFFAIIVGQNFGMVYILFMIIAQANAMLPSRPALAFSALVAGAYMALLISSGVDPEDLWNISISMLIGLTFTITLSQVLYRYIEQSERMERLLGELQRANLALREAQEKEKELTIAEERVRMARDLHDGLGHHLTALSIQLQAAEKLIRANPAMAGEAVHNARGEVQAALKEVRQSVAALRETPIDILHLPEAMQKLVAETGRLSGLQAGFEQQGQPAALTPAAAMTLFRAVQEGLTNVRKHAGGATQIHVRLVYGTESVELAIEDDGQTSADWVETPGNGFGLAGLRERVNLLGGSLDCGPRAEGGFRIAVSLPAITESQPEPASGETA